MTYIGNVLTIDKIKTNSSEIKVDNVFALKETSETINAISGYGKFYVKNDGNLYFKNSSGTETNLLSGSSGANTTLSNLTSPTAINQDLLASGTRNLGDISSGIWENLYTKNITIYNSSATPLSLERISTNPAKWDFNISQDPLGTGSFLSSGSLSIVSQTANTNFSIRVGNSSTSQFRIFSNYTEVVGNDTSTGYNFRLNNINATNENYMTFISHSNSYQGQLYYFGGSEYAWINITGNSHSTPSFFQIANDINTTNSRIGIRIVGVQKAIFKQRGIIFNPASITDSSTSPFMLRDDINVTGDAFKIEGDSGKDTSFWINQPASNKYFVIGGQAGSYSMWMTYAGTTHPTQPSRAFLSFDDPNGILGIRANNTNKFTVTYAGNIGIGDNFYNPSYMFHIKKETSGGDIFFIENTIDDAYSNIKSISTRGAFQFFYAGSNYGNIGITGSSHPSNPNLFQIYAPDTYKIKTYLGSNYYSQINLSSTYLRFSFGQNYETSAIFGIKRMSGDTADGFRIEDSSGNSQFKITSNGTIEVKNNITAGSTGYDIGSNSIRFQNVFSQTLDVSPTTSKPAITIGTGLSTTPVNGALEYDSSNGFYITHGSTRKLIATNSSISSNKYRGIYSLFYVDIDNTTDILTVDSGLSTASKLTYDLLDTGDGILFDTATLPTGINNTTIYYIRRISSTTFSLHPTKTDAINNTNKVDIIGSTNLTDRPMTVREFNLKGDTTLNGKVSTGSVITCNIPSISTLSDLDKFEIDYLTGANSTSIELTLNSTDFGNGIKFVYKSGSSFIISTSQTISIGNTSNAYTRIVVQYKATENYFIVSELAYS